MMEPQDFISYEEQDAKDKATELLETFDDLIWDVSQEGRQALESQQSRQRYKERILPFISRWSEDPKAINFVHEVLNHEPNLFHSNDDEERLFTVAQRKFLLEIAIPEDFQQLSDQPTGSNEQTALHIIFASGQTRGQVMRHYTELFCDAIRDGIKNNRLTGKDAADIISKTNRRGETCLHLALMEDSNDVERIIEFADDATFLQQRDNGNTPLHDALEFTGERHTGKPRYLVPFPECRMPSLMMEGDQRATDPTNFDTPKQTECCTQCWNVGREYRDLKERRFRIIHALVDNCPAALAIHNNTGESPFRYHVMAREDFRKKRPDYNTKESQGQRKSNRQSNIKLGGATNASRRLSNAPGYELQQANVGSLRSSKPFDVGGVALTRPHQAKEVQICSKSPPWDFFRLSVEVENLLWEAAFQVGGYDEARLCLFPRTDTLQGHHATVSAEDEKFQIDFFPTRRVTYYTEEQYANFAFMPTLAHVHLKVIPEPEVDDMESLKMPKPRADWRDKSSEALEGLFKWLTDTKKVKRILKLVVEDNEEFPCSETSVRKCLSMLQDIRYLDWRRPNISVRTLLEAKDMVEVWLYSTGINAVLASWADQEGLQMLQKLHTVHIDAKPAIRWAIRMNVEVISMSWNVTLAQDSDDRKQLEDAIRDADRANILLFCAASENKPSTSGNEVLPSACKETFSIGAASQYQHRRDYVGDDAVFLFPSEHDEGDDGSSAATALAAGLAGLILYCLKNERREQRMLEEQRNLKVAGRLQQELPSAAGDHPRTMMRRVFNNLCGDKGSKYVDINDLLSKDKVTYRTITKHCQPYLSTGSRKLGKGRP
ncbi:hypothetical protein K4K60_010027 [Colletotrichum sp. SAR11_57]|nr:hypothetical protein K4K60_010027 [Colletotrichum sp. SAR11_57]